MVVTWQEKSGNHPGPYRRPLAETPDRAPQCGRNSCHFSHGVAACPPRRGETSRSLASTGSIAIVTVILDGAHYIHELTVRETCVHRVHSSGRSLTVVDAVVAGSWKDSVDYATLSSGITYQLLATESVVIERWKEAIDLLANLRVSHEQPLNEEEL